LGEVPNVSYTPINWFDKVTLNVYAKDPARGNDPILSNMKNITSYPGYWSFNTNWGGNNMFSVRIYPKDKVCDTQNRKRKGKGQGNPQQGGGIFDILLDVVKVAETAAFAVDVIAFQLIDQIFNAYRWYLLEYMRLCEIPSSPCVRHDYIMTTKLRSTGKFFRGGVFRQLDDPVIQALLKVRPSFPPYEFYLKEVDTMGKKKQGGTRRRRRRVQKTRRRST